MPSGRSTSPSSAGRAGHAPAGSSPASNRPSSSSGCEPPRAAPHWSREDRGVSVGLARLRAEPDAIRRGAIDKGEDPSIVDAALAADARRRELQGEADALRGERNTVSKDIGGAIKAGARPEAPELASLRTRSTVIGQRLTAIDAELGTIEAQVEDLLLRIPNPAEPDVPVGGEDANVTIRSWGERLEAATAGWTRQPHWEIAERLG